MAYELTRYGEEKLETLPTKLEARYEKERARATARGVRPLHRDSTFYKLNKQLFLLDQIRRGNEPLEGSFSFLKEGPRKRRASEGLRKELAYMLKIGLIKEVA